MWCDCFRRDLSIRKKEALGDTVSYLKLGMVHPLPVDLIRNFANMVETTYVIEELDPIIETHCNRIGVNVIGKELFPICGELSQKLIKNSCFTRKTKCCH